MKVDKYKQVKVDYEQVAEVINDHLVAGWCFVCLFGGTSIRVNILFSKTFSK